MEEWRDIAGYEGSYKVYDCGRVKSVEHVSGNKHIREKILKGGKYPNGYMYVCLRKNGENKNYLTHRLVARAFISIPPTRFAEINHKDGDKTNNHADNLEWRNRAYNLSHAVKIGLMPSQCKIRRSVTVKCGEKITTFETMKDCAEFFGFKKGWLQNQIRKHGCTFNYGEYEIKVHERECLRR